MGFGPFSSESRNSSRVTQIDRRIAASDNAFVSAPNVAGGGKGSRTNAAIGGILVAGNSNTLTISDQGAIDKSFALAGAALSAQANLSAAAVGVAGAADARLAQVAETRLTDGGNLQQRTIVIGLAIVAALVAVVFWLRK